MRTRPTGLLVLRAWREEGAEVPLRVEIRLTRDVSNGFERELAASDEQAVIEVVTAWLTDIRDHPEGDPR